MMFATNRTQRPDVDKIAANHCKRWDITIEKDIVTSDSQRGVTSPYCQPGRFSHRDPLVHAIDNCILDRVLDPS